MLKNLIFDWSGTLVDDLHPVVATTNKVLQHYGREALTREEFLDRFELPYTLFYERYLPEATQEECETLYRKHFPTGGGEVSELDGARGFLEAARARGLRMFILTSVPQEHWDEQAAAVGFAGFFEETWTAVVDKCVFCVERVEALGLVPGETAFLGDMRHDMDAGKAAGLTTIATLTGYEGVEKLATSTPDHIVRDLHQATRLLETGSLPLRREFPIATVGALLFDSEDRVLLVRTEKWSGLWGIAGGKIEVGETAVEALRRETREETGLEISGVREVCVQDCIQPDEFFRPAHFLLLNYVARRVSGEVVLNDEAEEFRWVTLEAGLGMDLNKPTRVLLEQVRDKGLRPE